MTYIKILIFWIIIACIPIMNSVIFFRCSPIIQPISYRLLASAHGVSVCLVWLGVIAIAFSGHYDSSWAEPFRILCIVPLIFIGFSFKFFLGKEILHLLQIINLAWLGVIYLFGQMAVTNVWL